MSGKTLERHHYLVSQCSKLSVMFLTHWQMYFTEKCKSVIPFHTGKTEITPYLLFLVWDVITESQYVYLLTMCLGDTVDHGYFELFFAIQGMVWERSLLGLDEGWPCASAVLLSPSAALLPWGSCASQSLTSLLTACANVCSSFGTEITYLPRPCGLSLLTFNTSMLYFSSWRMPRRGFVLFSLANL